MFAESLDAFLRTDDFAVAATYDGATTVNGLFDNGHADAFAGVAVAGSSPSFVCKAADVAADPRGKTLLIGSATYTIREFQPDLTGGLVTLILEAS